MEAIDIEKIQKPRKMAAAAMFLLFAGGAYLTWQLTGEAQAMIAFRSDLETQQAALAQAESEYRQEVQRMEALGFNIDLIQGALESYAEFESDRLQIMYLFQKIGEGMGERLRLDTIAVDKLDSAQQSDPAVPGQPRNPAQLEAQLALSFPPTIQLEAGILEVNNLRNRLAGLLPEYDVVITRQVARPEYTENLKGEAGRTAEEIAAAEDYEARLAIRGPRQ
jgi:hypothetical protein